MYVFHKPDSAQHVDPTPITKPLNLREVFNLVRAYAFSCDHPLSNKKSLIEVIADTFDRREMAVKYDGQRQIIPSMFIKRGHPAVVVLTDLEKIKRILKSKEQQRPPVIRQAVEMVSNVPNVFTAMDKGDWQSLRRPMAKFLKPNAFEDIHKKTANDVIKEQCVKGKFNDVAQVAAIYSARVFGEAFLGYSFSDKQSLDISDAYSNVIQPKIVRSILSNSFFSKDLWRRPSQRKKLESAVKLFSDIADDIIQNALKTPEADSYVHALIDEIKRKKLSASQSFVKGSEAYQYVASQVMIMLAGGIEAPRKQLNTAMHFLARDADWQQKIQSEIGKDNDECNAAQDALREAVRLRGPVYVMLKEEDDISYIIPLSSLHLSHDAWGSDAKVFNPARYNDLSKLETDALLAFGGWGPHSCPGENLAYGQNKIFLNELLENGTLEPLANQQDMPSDRASFLIQPKPGNALRYE